MDYRIIMGSWFWDFNDEVLYFLAEVFTEIFYDIELGQKSQVYQCVARRMGIKVVEGFSAAGVDCLNVALDVASQPNGL